MLTIFIPVCKRYRPTSTHITLNRANYWHRQIWELGDVPTQLKNCWQALIMPQKLHTAIWNAHYAVHHG